MQQQHRSGSSFSVSYASNRLQRKQQDMIAQKNKDSSSTPSSPSTRKSSSAQSWTRDMDYHQLPSNVRGDIPREKLESQLSQIVQHRAQVLEEMNVEDYESVRRVKDCEKFYLRSLVGEAVTRQAKLGRQSAFLKKIMKAAALAAKRGKKDLAVKEEDAADYDFVSQSLARDIQQLLPKLGYSATLGAICSLQIWQLE